MKKVMLDMDGVCSGNPGTGGWGAILFYNSITAVMDQLVQRSEGMSDD